MFNKAISKISFTEDLTLITLANAPKNRGVIASIFREIAGAGINVDMISQAPPYREAVSVSFSVLDKDFAPALKIIGKFQGDLPGLRTDVNPGNVKITAFGEEMRDTLGVAADFFDILDKAGVSIKLISTSEVDISVLIASGDMEKAARALR